MPFLVFAAVLLGAALHASWNAVIKDGGNKVFATIMVATFAAVAAVIVVSLQPLPRPESWPYLGTSTLIHVVYFALVARAYRLSDMGLTYPLMRGSAPLLVALGSVALLGEHLTPPAWIGVALISAGILTMVLGRQHGDGHGVLTALANAVVIAAYTLTDATGGQARGISGSLRGVGISSDRRPARDVDRADRWSPICRVRRRAMAWRRPGGRGNRRFL